MMPFLAAERRRLSLQALLKADPMIQKEIADLIESETFFFLIKVVFE